MLFLKRKWTVVIIEGFSNMSLRDFRTYAGTNRWNCFEGTPPEGLYLKG